VNDTVTPPIEPMLAKLVDALPTGEGFLFEPKWDGFRAIVFRTQEDVYIQSRDLRPLDRYFPELHDALLERIPPATVVDGEIVIATSQGLDFDALQLRLHPAASRVAKLAKESPASFVVFDVLAVGGRSVMDTAQHQRRQMLEALLSGVEPPVYLTPMTRDRRMAAEWLERFEGAGLDGVIAKPADATYQPGKRAMFKIKHARTADCVVAGFRWHKAAPDAIGSLLLGLYDDQGTLHHVGVTSSFSMAARKALVAELEPLRNNVLASHPWRSWAETDATGQRMPGGQSRWSAGKDLSWEPLRIERVCEVKYDHLQGDRFRHATTFLRWRPDRKPSECRYDQLDVTPAYELEKVFGAGRSSG
jgi:ATP-dependent DNA ligase